MDGVPRARRAGKRFGCDAPGWLRAANERNPGSNKKNARDEILGGFQ